MSWQTWLGMFMQCGMLQSAAIATRGSIRPNTMAALKIAIKDNNRMFLCVFTVFLSSSKSQPDR
jgi:hypothetical protein